jgi:hypothetical protein
MLAFDPFLFESAMSDHARTVQENARLCQYSPQRPAGHGILYTSMEKMIKAAKPFLSAATKPLMNVISFFASASGKNIAIHASYLFLLATFLPGNSIDMAKQAALADKRPAVRFTTPSIDIIALARKKFAEEKRTDAGAVVSRHYAARRIAVSAGANANTNRDTIRTIQMSPPTINK